MGEPWVREEIELIVADYLAMLLDELRGIPFSKTEHRRALIPKLNGRHNAAVEFKHRNISAVLLMLGCPYIDGYKPLFNFQQETFPSIVQQQVESSVLLQALLEKSASASPVIEVPGVADILKALVEPPERLEKTQHKGQDDHSRHMASKRDFLALEARNAQLGLLGEKFVVNYEKARLIAMGKESLAQRIEHSSQAIGDWLGYDIRSFNADGKERLIEVKTTKYGRYVPFYLSPKEIQVSKDRADSFSLYRVFSFGSDTKLFMLSGELGAQLILTPTQFRAEL